jgi:glycosyltransferase involved in cell wall biosynthesis
MQPGFLALAPLQMESDPLLPKGESILHRVRAWVIGLSLLGASGWGEGVYIPRRRNAIHPHCFMKIAFISYECLPDTGGGGIGTYIPEASQMLARRGHHVEVFAGSPTRQGTEETGVGVRIHRILVPTRECFATQVAPVYSERQRQIGFDVLEGPDYMADAFLAAKQAPGPALVVKLHVSRQLVNRIRYCQLPFWRRQLSRIGTRLRREGPYWSPRHPVHLVETAHVLQADELAAPSHAMAAQAAQQWGLRRETISVFPLPFTPTREYLEIPPGGGQNVVGYFGRLEPLKGAVDLVRAIPDVLRRHPATEFWFVGSSTPEMTQSLCRILGSRRDSVRFLGPVAREAIPTLLAQTRVCVFPSLWESFGYACCEAMAAARAVIGTKACGLEEVLGRGEAGRLVRPNCPVDLAESLIECLGDGDLRLRLGRAARECVLRCFNQDVVGPAQESSYERAIKRRQTEVS